MLYINGRYSIKQSKIFFFFVEKVEGKQINSLSHIDIVIISNTTKDKTEKDLSNIAIFLGPINLRRIFISSHFTDGFQLDTRAGGELLDPQSHPLLDVDKNPVIFFDIYRIFF